MFEKIKKELALLKIEIQLEKGMEKNKIIPFDNEFYEKMSHTFFAGIPVSMRIKYLKPTIPPGGCYDRSLYMFFCFPEALLVRADVKSLELRFGKEKAGHGWIEIGDYVYDPSSMMRFDRDLYYSIYSPTNVEKTTKEEYCSSEEGRMLYEDITSTTIKDLQPHGRKRVDLLAQIISISSIAEISGNQEFINELNEYLSAIQYDEQEIFDETCELMHEMFVKEKIIKNK